MRRLILRRAVTGWPLSAVLSPRKGWARPVDGSAVVLGAFRLFDLDPGAFPDQVDAVAVFAERELSTLSLPEPLQAGVAPVVDRVGAWPFRFDVSRQLFGHGAWVGASPSGHLGWPLHPDHLQHGRPVLRAPAAHAGLPLVPVQRRLERGPLIPPALETGQWCRGVRPVRFPPSSH
jgi:hypothetical protein